MPAPTPDDPSSNILRSIVEHVFMPPQLPQEDPGEQIEKEANVALCDSLIDAAQEFREYLTSEQFPLWDTMIKMMKSARLAARAPDQEADLQDVLLDMAIEGPSIYLSLSPHWVLIICYQTYLRCISVHKMLVSLCAGLPPPTSFSLRSSKSRHRIVM